MHINNNKQEGEGENKAMVRMNCYFHDIITNLTNIFNIIKLVNLSYI